ncbi:MAG: ABC transporter ATP-binding protein [Alphaproteobacteria bacterium]|nr:ABC transporter ATP-binding protein [Alphaproteobacteria bacterium]
MASIATAPGPTPPAAIEAVGINKRFGPVQANRDVTLSVAKGTIHGIIGENGAGKSTLMSILYGYYQADSGTIRVNGREVRMADSAEALSHGVGMVHQHFMLVDTFTALENIVLGVEGGALLAAGLAAARTRLEALQRDYQLDVPLDTVVGDLPVGLRQRIEILKALFRGADILILDEPTGVLTPQEADHLFRILRSLKAEGKTVILITHKLREIMDVTDAVTVMRQGTVVAEVRTAETNREALAELMVGRKVATSHTRGAAAPGAAFLTVSDLAVRDDLGVERVKGISFTVRAGEIVGIAGVSGNGQSELLEALSGIRVPSRGTITLRGTTLTPAALDARRLREAKVAHVPEDRQRMGLITAFDADESAILGYHRSSAVSGAALLKRRTIVERCRDAMQRFDVRPSNPRLRTSLFSGGNQQKIVLAREIDQDPDVLLVGQPTRGVDIGAIEFIHRRLLALRDAGKAILLVSVELEEILALADRILVMFDGHLVGEMDRSAATERRLGLMMAGIAEEAA